MYQVQFKSSGKVAYTTSELANAKYWIECNDYGPEVPETDPDTGELTGHWLKGACLNLFLLKKVNK